MTTFERYLTESTETITLLVKQQENYKAVFPQAYYQYIIDHLQDSRLMLKAHHDLIGPVIEEQHARVYRG